MLRKRWRVGSTAIQTRGPYPDSPQPQNRIHGLPSGHGAHLAGLRAGASLRAAGGLCLGHGRAGTGARAATADRSCCRPRAHAAVRAERSAGMARGRAMTGAEMVPNAIMVPHGSAIMVSWNESDVQNAMPSWPWLEGCTAASRSPVSQSSVAVPGSGSRRGPSRGRRSACPGGLGIAAAPRRSSMVNLAKNATSWIVYSISDPRTGLSFYVGLTSNLKQRRLQHKSDAYLPSYHRINEIIASGMQPIFVVVAEHVDQHNALEHEHKLIMTMPWLLNRGATHRKHKRSTGVYQRDDY